MTMDMIDNTLRSLLIDAALAETEDSEGKEYSPTDRFKLALNKALKSRGFDPFYTFFAIKRRRALAIIAAVAAALALTMSVGAIRERVVNFFVEMFDTYAVISVDKNTGYPKTIEERYAPSYIPEGYEFYNSYIDLFESESIWKNKTGGELIFSQLVKHTVTLIDAEEHVKNVNVFGENDGVLWESHGSRSIYFEYGCYFYRIISQPGLSEDELIKMAKSIEKYELTKS